MNLEVLKQVFFFGTEEEIDETIRDLKPRCIQPSDKTVNVNGTPVKTVWNSENDTYISQFRETYKICPYCNQLEKLSNFVTVTIEKVQRKRIAGQRNFIKTVTLCLDCLDSSTIVVPQFESNEYLYADNPNTCRLTYKDHSGVIKETYFDMTLRDRRHYTNLPTMINAMVFNFETNTVDYRTEDRHAYAADVCAIVHDIPRTPDENGNSEIIKNCFLFESVVESHPETFQICSECGGWFLASDLEDGKCVNCRSIKIYTYHRWDGQLKFLKSSEDSADEKMFFGTEVETCGTEDNRRYVTPYRNIWHLEHDASLDAGGFEMISQPMTLKYAKEHFSDFETMFKNLQDNGQKSHDTSCCGYHVHVSRNAFNDDDAINRAFAIVNKFKFEIVKFARRNGNRFCIYTEIPDDFSERDLNQIVYRNDDSRYNCVNLTNRRDDKKTIEFRMFRGTLNPITYLATLEFVSNIVRIANENPLYVKFADLLEGEYISQYIEERAKYNVTFDTEKTISFVAYKLGKQFEMLCHRVITPEQFTEQVNLAFAMEGGAA